MRQWIWWLFVALVEGAFVLFLENRLGLRRLGRGPLLIELVREVRS